jgi:hypothetical protein
MVDDPAFHQVFIDAVRDGVSMDTSLYIDAGVVIRWLIERIQEVENGVVAPDRAMDMLAAEIDRQIRINLEERPDLRERYRIQFGAEYVPAP